MTEEKLKNYLPCPVCGENMRPKADSRTIYSGVGNCEVDITYECRREYVKMEDKNFWGRTNVTILFCPGIKIFRKCTVSYST